jgi:hypothetical protein
MMAPNFFRVPQFLYVKFGCNPASQHAAIGTNTQTVSRLPVDQAPVSVSAGRLLLHERT